jgi:hypothetical protein
MAAVRRTRARPVLTKEECREIERRKAEAKAGEERAGRILRIVGYCLVGSTILGAIIFWGIL